MRKILYILAVLLAVVSCKNDELKLENIETPSMEFTFTADILSRATLDDIKKTFVLGERLSCFTKPYYNEKAKADIHEMVYDGNLFRSEVPIMIAKGNPQYAYAFYPCGNYDNIENIPISIEAQTEYLYASSMISYENPSPTMSFSHMLSVLAFNFSDKVGGRKIEKITIGENTPIPIEGTFSFSSMSLTHTKRGVFELPCSKDIPQNGMKDSLPQFFILPHSLNDGLDVIFMVSGTKYSCTLPVLRFERGRKYIFSVAFSENSAAILDTTVVSLDSEESVMPSASVSQIKIVHTCTYYAIPDFVSDTMYGRIDWGDNSTEPFSATAIHAYKQSGAYQTDIEIWNPKSVTFNDLTGIKHIDFTSF
ncbi:MAG: fimbrillin family protein [Alistipes sp.]|nr:fimbrillin family protein [Candidatus Alistipes equi]